MMLIRAGDHQRLVADDLADLLPGRIAFVTVTVSRGISLMAVRRVPVRWAAFPDSNFRMRRRIVDSCRLGRVGISRIGEQPL